MCRIFASWILNRFSSGESLLDMSSNFEKIYLNVSQIPFLGCLGMLSFAPAFANLSKWRPSRSCLSKSAVCLTFPAPLPSSPLAPNFRFNMPRTAVEIASQSSLL